MGMHEQYRILKWKRIVVWTTYPKNGEPKMVLLNLKISRLLCVSTLSQPYGISEYNVF